MTNTEESEHDAYVRLAKAAAQRAHSAIETAEQAAARLNDVNSDAIKHGYLLGSAEHDRALGISHMQMAQSRQMAAAYASLGTLYATLAGLVDRPESVIMHQSADLSPELSDRIRRARERLQQDLPEKT